MQIYFEFVKKRCNEYEGLVSIINTYTTYTAYFMSIEIETQIVQAEEQLRLAMLNSDVNTLD
jgi:hypothetical protein